MASVVEIEHGLHAALLKLGHEVVETVEDGVVVDAGGSLQHGHDVGGLVFFAVAAHEHAQVVDAGGLQQVELAGQALAVAASAFGGENGAVPEVGADVAVHGVADAEFAVGHGDVVCRAVGIGGGGCRLAGVEACYGCHGAEAAGCGVEELFHGYMRVICVLQGVSCRRSMWAAGWVRSCGRVSAGGPSCCAPCLWRSS